MNKKKPRKKCKNCGGEPARFFYTYCSNHCQAEYRYKQFINNWLSGKISGNITNNMRVCNGVRRWLRETKGNKCEKCGWKKINPITKTTPLEVSHIDGNHLNSCSENLELICPNCHSLTSTYRNLNKGKGRKSRRDPIVAIGSDL